MSYQKPNFTAQQQAQRWLDRRTIENLMGKRFSLKMLAQQANELEEVWCKTAEPCLGCKDGYYKGREALEAYFAAIGQQYAQRVQYAKANYDLSGKTDEELHGVGSLSPYTLSTPLIEVADDGNTAKGMWYIIGAASEMGKKGAEAAWYRGKVWVDFIKEDDQWKIWHLTELADVFCYAGTNWADAMLEEKDFAAVDTALPAVNVPAAVSVPAIPVPYGTFEDTFSYGI